MTGSRSQDVGYAVGATEPRRATCERNRSMPSNLRYLGLDVHAETIAVAVAEPDGEVHPLGIMPNRPSTITHYAGLCHPLPTLSTGTDFAIVHHSPRCSGETKGKPV